MSIITEFMLGQNDVKKLHLHGQAEEGLSDAGAAIFLTLSKPILELPGVVKGALAHLPLPQKTDVSTEKANCLKQAKTEGAAVKSQWVVAKKICKRRNRI